MRQDVSLQYQEGLQRPGIPFLPVDPFQIHYDRRVQLGKFLAGGGYEVIERFFRQELPGIDVLGRFQAFPGSLDITPGVQLDACQGIQLELAGIDLYIVDIDPYRLSLGYDRVDYPGAGKGFSEATECGLEVVRPGVAVATGPEHLDEPVAMHPLIAGYHQITEKDSRLLAFPEHGDRQPLVIDG